MILQLSPEDFSVSVETAKKTIALPIYLELQYEQIEYIGEKINSFYKIVLAANCQATALVLLDRFIRKPLNKCLKFIKCSTRNDEKFVHNSYLPRMRACRAREQG